MSWIENDVESQSAGNPLPELNELVLVYMPESDEPVLLGYLGMDTGGVPCCGGGPLCFFLADNRKPEHPVTHWMPLPEGP